MAFFQKSDSGAYQRKLSHLKNLIAIAFADTRLNPKEVDLLYQVSSRLNISQEDVEKILENPASISFIPPKTEREKFLRLYELVSMMLVDNDMDTRELELCRQFALNLGYKEEDVSELITTISNSILNGTSVDKTYQENTYVPA